MAPEPEELSREQMEEQLMSGELGEEEESEGLEVERVAVEEGKPSPEPQMTVEELQEKLARLEEETKNKTAALAEERDRRKISEGQYAQIMDYLQEARERAAQAQQQTQPQEDYSEYEDVFRAIDSKYGTYLQQLQQRQMALENFIQQNLHTNQQAQQFAQQSQQFKAQRSDYDQAMNFLVDKVRAQAEIFIQDPNQREMVVAQEAQKLINYSPEQLYRYAQTLGYAPAQGQQGQPVSQAAPQRPKSLAGVAGATGNLPETWENKAQKVVSSNLKDLDKIPLEDLDALLKQMR